MIYKVNAALSNRHIINTQKLIKPLRNAVSILIFSELKNTELDLFFYSKFSYYQRIQIKDPKMEFKAKIKSMTQYSIRGTRIFPPQVIAHESNKSISINEKLTNSNASKNNLPFEQNHQPEVSRFNNRHTTEIEDFRPSISRLSLDQLNKNRSSQPSDSNRGNQSDRNSGFQNQSQNLSTKVNKQESASVLLSRLIIESNESNAFKELRIQKVASNQTTMDRSQFENYCQKTQQIEKQYSPSRKLQNGSEPQVKNINIWQNLYSQYKEKYNSLQRDYLQLVARMKDADAVIETLHRDNEKYQSDLSNSHKLQAKIDEQQKKILKLQESIRINRNLNELLMKKDKESEKKLKYVQENNDIIMKKKIQEIKILTIRETTEKYEQIIAGNQKLIFELKLKLIDQANQFQQSNKQNNSQLIELRNEKSKLLEQTSKISHQKMDLFSEYSIIKFQLQGKNVAFAQLCMENDHLKATISNANQQISMLTAQIIRIDQQNLRLDQQNYRISCESQNQIAQCNDQIDQINSQCHILERENEELVETLQDKEAIIAQINVAKNNALLQILQLKNDLRKKKQQEEKEIARKYQRQQQIQMIRINQSNQRKEIQNLNKKLVSIYQEQQQMKRQSEPKIKLLQLLKSQLFQQNNQLQQKINSLINQISQLKRQLQNASEKYERQYHEKWKQNEDMMNQSLLFKLQMLQQLKKSSQEKGKLHEKIILIEKQNNQLQLNISKIKQQKQIVDKVIQQKIQMIMALKEEINSYQMLQIQRSDALKQKQSVIQNRQNQLKEVEQQYLELIEGQLRKIQNIHDSDWDQVQAELADRFQSSPSKSKKDDDLQKGLSPHQTPNKKEKEQSCSSEQLKFESEIAQLTMRVEELTFVNQALQQKVQELTQLQENSNALILQKIRAFEVNLQKTLHEKNDADFHNAQLMHRVGQLTQKCIVYEGRIQWLDNNYRQLQANLFETQEELLRSSFQYINLKLMRQLEHAFEENEGNDQEQPQLNNQLQQIEEAIINYQKNRQDIKQQKENDMPQQYEEDYQAQEQGKILLEDIENQQKEEIVQKQDNIFNEQINLLNQCQRQMNEYIQQEQIVENPHIQINIISVSSEDQFEEEYLPLINVIYAQSDDQNDQDCMLSFEINILTVNSEDQEDFQQNLIKSQQHEQCQIVEEPQVIEQFIQDRSKCQNNQQINLQEDEIEMEFDVGQEDTNENEKSDNNIVDNLDKKNQNSEQRQGVNLQIDNPATQSLQSPQALFNQKWNKLEEVQ